VSSIDAEGSSGGQGSSEVGGSGGIDAEVVLRSSRNHDVVRGHLEGWLATKLPEGANPRITSISGTGSTGMSSDTMLFDVTWNDGGHTTEEQLVARVAPLGDDVPVFRSYDLDKQFEAIRLVGELSKVPVPRVRWYEADPSLLGGTFFVMDRVHGVVPSDAPAYVLGGWLFEASAEERRALQDATVRTLVDIHAIEGAEEHFGFLQYPLPGDSALRRHVADRRAWYDFAVSDVGRSPLVERCFAYIDEHWPEEGPPVLSWGDARIGNILFRDFAPVAVLDWEMAGIAPREVDLGWMIYLHRVFQRMSEQYGFVGIPEFMRFDDVAATYEAESGHTPRQLELFVLYSAMQFGIVGMRTSLRSARFGASKLPDNVDDLLLNRADLEVLLAEVSRHS
jgi:aminoglycoside phosphotransferase (APT) family kinase protein